MKTKVRTIKKTFSIRENLVEELSSYSNKSKLVNEWIELVLKRRRYEEAFIKKAKEEMEEMEKFMLKHNIERVEKDDPDYKVFEEARKNPNPVYYTVEEFEKEFNLWS